MNEPSRPVISTFVLMVISPFIALGSLTLFSFADVHNTYDFLVPVIGIMQFIFVVGLFIGRLWGLIGYSITVVGLVIATFAYYTPKDQTDVAIKTSTVFLPLILLTIYYWTVKRRYFK